MRYPIGFKPGDIFNVKSEDFVVFAEKVFCFQYQFNKVYRKFTQLRSSLDHFGADNEPLTESDYPTRIPFLPISFFKTHPIMVDGETHEIVFSSSGTSGMAVSRHFVQNLSLYEESFIRGFLEAYGSPTDYAFLCLLPSYLERKGSSLIYMAQKLIDLSKDPDSGFFLESKGKLTEVLVKRELSAKKTILLGVSFALLDFALENPIELKHTIVIETGGMKGRRKEVTRSELHGVLKAAFKVSSIHSEYGMTEILSQAYSKGEGIYYCPPWMRVLVREEDDPFSVKEEGSGILCIIDLANLYSCSFIETADAGCVFPDGSFEVLGRIDHSDIRGCSLLVP